MTMTAMSRKLTGMSDLPKSQADKFQDLARQLEFDEDEDPFDERLKKLATKTPPSQTDTDKL
jgi:hypothetical protein